VGISEDAHLGQPDEGSVSSMPIKSRDEVPSKDGSKLLAIPDQVRHGTSWLVVAIDHEDRDVSQLQEVSKGNGCALGEKLSIALGQRGRNLALRENVASLKSDDALHVRTCDSREPPEETRLRVGDQDGWADPVQKGNETVDNHLGVIRENGNSRLQELLQRFLAPGKLRVRVEVGVFRAEAPAQESLLMANGKGYGRNDLSARQIPQGPDEGWYARPAPPGKVHDVHREASTHEDRLESLPTVRRCFPDSTRAGAAMDHDDRQAPGINGDLKLRVQLIDLPGVNYFDVWASTILTGAVGG
jgi:hypothetical protein